jgi:4-hydroxy-2-oxoheptanedioate aldolase
MRNSRVVQKLRAGKPVICTKINTTDPVIVDMIGMVGFDCVWMCNEHSAIDWDRLGNLIRAAIMNDMDTVVRVAKGGYSDYVRPLELGAAGIMVPHCMSGIEARQVARWTRFHPVGRRPLDGGNSDARYTFTPLTDYMREANEKTFVIVQIEEPEALENVESIAEVDGIDLLFIGPADYTQALGVPGQMDHPQLAEAIQRVAQVCRKSGKNWGLPVSLETLPKYVSMGARFLTCGADVIGLREYYCELRAGLQSVGIEFGRSTAVAQTSAS